MEKITRKQFMDLLENNWKAYVERFNRLPPQNQALFLENQGYATFAGLLAHIIAWWQDGALMVAQMRSDPSLPLAEYDVDAFNAQAVERFSSLSEAEVIQRYEAQRQVMLELVASLSDAELNYDNINTRLYFELMYHWTEHALSRFLS